MFEIESAHLDQTIADHEDIPVAAKVFQKEIERGLIALRKEVTA